VGGLDERVNANPWRELKFVKSDRGKVASLRSRP